MEPRASIALLSWLAAATVAPGEPGDGVRNPEVISDRAVRADVEWALARAIRNLERPGCRMIFSDFVDSEGRTLQQDLDLRGQTGPDLLRSLVFRDGTGERPCTVRGILAFTKPGSPIISICGPSFREALRNHPALAANILLHEGLHRLGLEETSRIDPASFRNLSGRTRPPTSTEITDRVASRCGN